MINRRDVLRGTAASLLAGHVVAQETGDPFGNATAAFNKPDQYVLPSWAFSQRLCLPPTPRPTRIGTFSELDGQSKVFGPTDPIPIGRVFHGIAREWSENPDHWCPQFGCDPRKTGQDAWDERRKCFGSVAAHDDSGQIHNWGHFPIKCYKMPIRESLVQLRPDAGGRALVYGYDGMVPGPTYKFRLGQPVVIRYDNHLQTEVSVHLHGGHNPSHSDGFPTFYILQGKSRDYFYPNILPLIQRAGAEKPAPDEAEAQSTIWYHDHAMDATGYNVAKGLAGFALCYGEKELKLIKDGVLPGCGAESCHDPELEGRSEESDLEDPDNPGYYLPGKEPYHNPFELPLVLQDKVIDRNTGQIAYNSDAHNGYLGDTFFVNGQPWPYRDMHNRKYRIRVLNGSNARVYRLRLLSEDVYRRAMEVGLDEEELEAQSCPFLQIGKDSWLWSHALERKSTLLTMANRADLVVDFPKLTGSDEHGPTGPRTFYLVNTMPQTDGRGPSEKLDDFGDPRVLPIPFDLRDLDEEQEQQEEERDQEDQASLPPTRPRRVAELKRPIALLKFEVKDEAPPEQDATVECGTPLIEKHRIEDHEVTAVREFIFERSKGAWQVNGRFYDPTIANAAPISGRAEEWVLRNGGGGWWHPIHIHLESHQLVSYKKDFEADEVFDPGDPPALRPLVNLEELFGHLPEQERMGFHDTIALGPNTVVRIRMRFRTFNGPFVFHCHNLEHEDMRMMMNFEPVASTGETPHDPNVAPAARTHGNDLTLHGKTEEHPGKLGELPWEYPPVPDSSIRDVGENVIPPRRSKDG
ncbi:multicopper oxidase family protein [Tautonia marina]|uniref:multicopper oxidase family protein n=1 Tax=Tautonia marina TaxID=2653855 RepID=UPI001260EA06|nr:multicopper oxidase domain-containing protein [Tautonia marina]